jgi:aminoglycoside phosphotransferase (APT) family kinase protein
VPAFLWFNQSLSDPDKPVALLHGGAEPGNFLFEAGRPTALIDWELVDRSDPTEDFTRLSMHCVREPVPDFSHALTACEAARAAPFDQAHILHDRGFLQRQAQPVRAHLNRRHAGLSGPTRDAARKTPTASPPSSAPTMLGAGLPRAAASS